ncbi:unnamed protein product [Schistosoma margrebowiei]|uniref:Transcription factor TFIIIC triple barrel domain-containing protein n=1 Tax=Schistosoma margrebowiei TaxID=48269 RepID=A0AA85AB81_9TREM|nr:unnamed protein product [Schistosoma margrebowiei]
MSSFGNFLKQKVLPSGSRTNLRTKFHTYFKQLVRDYISSGRDSLQLIRQNPVRSTLWASAVLAVSYITSTCPNKQNYYASLVESAIDLWEVPDLIRNSGSASYIHKCLKLFSKEQIRILFKIAFWILDSWENGGSCHTTWITMTSILTNGKLQKSSRSSPGKSRTNNSFKSSAKPSQPTCSSSHFKPFEDQNCSGQNIELHLNSPNNTSDDWEIINEEVLYVDCQGLLEDDILTPSSVIRLVDIESDRPLMQVGPAVFEGRYEDTVGTYLFFENNSTLPIEGASLAPARKMDDQTPQHTTSYVAKSSKSLTFQRIFLKAKEGNH